MLFFLGCISSLSAVERCRAAMPCLGATGRVLRKALARGVFGSVVGPSAQEQLCLAKQEVSEPLPGRHDCQHPVRGPCLLHSQSN